MIIVSGSSMASISRTTWSRKCALTARITRSWGPAWAALSTALTLAVCSLPSSQTSFRPSVLDRGELGALVDHGHRMAGGGELRRHQAADRAGPDHADPHRARLTLDVLERHRLHELVAERADALDRDLDPFSRRRAWR